MPNPRTRPARSVRQPSDLTRGLAAGIALLALVVGVPVLLAGTIGWPLPHSLPTLAEIRSALVGTRIPDEAILKGLAFCAWAYWLHLIWCLIVETLATARGRLPRRVPLGGLNQAIASRLVAALLLLGPTSMSVRPTTAAVVSDSPAVVQHLPAASTSLGDRGTAGPADQGRSSPPKAHEVSHPSGRAVVGADGHRGDQRQKSPSRSPTYTVRRGDTLWGIAERELGDPLRWRELERLNRGRLQPDGDRLQDPDLIRPGWRLLLPANRSIPQAHGRQPGEHHRQGAGTPVEPPGGTPPTTQPATTTTPAPTSTSAAPTTEAPTSTNPPPTLQPTKPHRPPGAIAPIAAALGVGLLAAGVLAVLARLRRIQQRHVARGRRIRLPTGTAADVERAMRATAEPEATAFLDLALRVLAGVIRRDGLPVPAIQAALLSETALELLLASPAADAPAPFVATDDGRRWMLPRDRSLDDFAGIAVDAIPPLPALVTIGQTGPDPPVRLLVNLEATGLLAVPGPPDRAAALCNAVAAELATSSWSGFFDLVLVGGFGAELAPLERVQQAPSLEAVLPRLQRRVAEATTTLEELGSSTALEGRILHTAGDSLVPTVVVCAEPPSAESLQRLAAVLQQTPLKQPPLAVLSAGDVPQARWQLRIDAERARLDPFGIDVQPQQLGPAELAAIGELLRTAADTGGVPADAPPYDQVHTPTPADALGPAAPMARTIEHEPTTADGVEAADGQTGDHRTTEPGTVEVAILGKIELRGVPKIERAKAIEAIVYLAMHPDGVDAERLWEALWPDKPVNRGTFHTTITAARSGLGDAPDGTRYMRNPHEGIYRLHPAVQLDWASFQTLVEQGRSAGPEGKALLRQALELVRGLPLESTAPRSYSWAVVHRTEIESAIAEAAQDLGDLCLAGDDPTGATWAARRGLLASPYDERLYRILMRAAHAAGNPAGVDTVLRELLHVLGAEDDPVDELHPQTVELYRQLRPRRSILT
jgi:DNA-binding SARP family transcriptional activator/LysM repeat protein